MGGWEEGYFEFGQSYDLLAVPGSLEWRRAVGIQGIKRELVYNGFGEGLKLDRPIYGTAMRDAVVAFKKAKLPTSTPNDIVGPTTSKALYRKRVLDAEADFDVPNNYACRLLDLEALWYISAWNETKDASLAQIHDPDDLEEAFDPAYSIPYSAQRLDKAHDTMKAVKKEKKLTSTWTQLWWAAIASHNAPAWADDWLIAGTPETGGDVIKIGDPDDPVWEGEKYAWLTLYKNAVLRRTC